MPMSFPDMKSLCSAADVHDFRQPHESESEDEFRVALAEHVKPRDFIESHEILTGKGWNEWNADQETSLLKRLPR